MDKITKALEQARLKRHSVGNAAVAEPVLEVASKEIVTGEIGNEINSAAIRKFHPDNSVLEKNRIINQDSSEEVVQPYKVLRTRFMQVLKENGWSNIAVTSPTKNDGKTTVAINLAISIASSMKSNSVLLDLDLWGPTIHTYFDYNPDVGLEAYFEKNTALEQIIVSPEMDGLVIAPSSRPLRESSEYLSTDKSIELLSKAQNILPDTVVISDLPPLLISDDAISFLPYVDAVLLVIREGKTSKQDIEQAIELLENVNIAGVVLTDAVDASSHGYYYY